MDIASKLKQGRRLICTSALVSLAAGALLAEEITIATVNNSDMIIMQELSSQWEEKTGNSIDWVVLEENVLRQRVTTDIATDGGSFDIITIGAYEAPIWGAQDWLVGLDDLGDDYDYEDIFAPVRNGLSANGAPLCRSVLCGKLVHFLSYRSVPEGWHHSARRADDL